MNIKKVMGWSWGAPLKLLLYVPLAYSAFDKLISVNHLDHLRTFPLPTSFLSILRNVLFLSVIPTLIAIVLFGCGAILWAVISIKLFELYLSITHKQPQEYNTTLVMVVFFVAIPYLAKIVSTLAMIFIQNFSLVSNLPLRQTIEKNLQHSILGFPPVVITLAESVPPFRLLLGSTATPIYVRLQQQVNTHDEAIDFLVQTAALPEIFPTRPVWGRGGRLCVDGGIADNTPIFGVAADRPDTVIVVYLDHGISKRGSCHAAEAWRLSNIAKKMGKEWVSSDDEDWFYRTQFLPIIPSRPLGAYRGTFDFSTATARKLIQLGYKDTLRQLQRAANSVSAAV